MNWDAIGAVGELIGATAVVVSVVYLGFQVRQGTAATRSLTRQEHSNAAQEFNSLIAANPDFAKLIVKANDDNDNLAAHERVQLQHHYISLFTLWQSAYENHNQGLLDETGWYLWNNGCRGVLVAQRGMRDTWGAAGDVYGPSFTAHVNETIDKCETFVERSGVWSPSLFDQDNGDGKSA